MRTWVRLIIVIMGVVAIGATGMLMAGNAGKIKGRVTEKDSGQPLPGVSILLVGTTQGAVTDLDGNYMIHMVPPGSYTMRFSTVGYATVEVEKVVVESDKTTEQNVVMEPATAELGIIIKGIANRDKINKHEVSSKSASARDQIQCMPVTNVDKLVQNSAGVITTQEGEVKIHGGRAGEVMYDVSGKKICPSPHENMYYPPAHGGTAIVNGEAFDAMFFKNYGVNPFVDTEDDHFSTFAIDVDDASFIMTRSYLERGEIPPDEAVRVEEFVNHFKYNYKSPRVEPFSVEFEGAPSKFGQNSYLLRFGIQGKNIRPENRKAANLVFVIDISGSMSREDRLGLVKKALKELVNELTEEDQVGIVVYGSRGEVRLHPTSIEDKHRILDVIECLQSQGSTNAEEGLRLGYQMADAMFEKDKINRIILCSDGVANVGVTGPDEMLKGIKRYADKGITLSAIGFGMGNFNDVLMEKLGDKGNGHYAYVDDIAEARRIFVENLTGTLQVIARDVKIQVDFNPEVVRSYRLLGYENRDVADDKFRDDKEDGGEIGSGHQVTALYEVKLHDDEVGDNLGTIFIRYKDPTYNEVTEINHKIYRHDLISRFANTSTDFRLATAAAEFSEILRKSYWARDSKLDNVMALAKEVYREEDRSDVLEFMNLISKAQKLEDQLAERE